MQTTAARIFAALDTRDPSITATAAALGVSKQTYSLARQRARLSDDLCIRACALLGIDPAPAIINLRIDTATTPEAVTVWKDILERLPRHPQAGSECATDSKNKNHSPSGDDSCDDLYYVKFQTDATIHGMRSLNTKRTNLAERLCQWMLCVPRLSPASPRFEYYADHWNVIDKIHRFTASGEFETIVKNCPAFSAEELRAALDYIDRSETVEKPRQTTASTNQRQALAR